MTDRPIPPVAKVEPLSHEQLGRRRTDDYAWMKDDNWREVLRDPSAIKSDVKDHLEAENAYAKAMLAPTEALQAAMFQEMKGRMKEDDSSAPTPDGPWEYYVRYEPGAQHPVHARRPRGSPDGEQALLDADAEAKGKAFFQVIGAEHSPDHALYAYAVDEQGSEVCRIYVKDLATGELLPEPVESGTGDFVFSPCSQWLFWIWRDADGRPAKLYRRPARGSDDTLVYEEEDDGFFMGVSVTASRAYIALGLGNQETSEARLIPACDPTLDPFVVEPRTEGLRYEVEHWADAGGKSHFVIRTNADGAVDFKLVLANEADPSRRTWRDLVPHEPGRFIVGVTAFRGHLARLERVNANNRIVIAEAGTLAEHAIDFDEEAYALGLEGGYEYDTPTLRFVYQSPTTPRQWFDYDMTTRRRTLRKTQEIPSGHDPAAYVTRRLYAPASDGAQVPITVLMKAGTPLDGSAPLLLYGYGSYGAAMEPSFSIRNLSLVDRGWIWATAHIRGGSEKGWGWFLDGRREKKMNSFTDFIACADHLTAAGYGRPGRIVAYGGSAGGMLMGAVANLRPELWAGIIAAVPFVDVLNTMSDTSLPLTPPEWPEWGNPLEDAAAYDYIASYSPYDNVAALPYPAVLATGGLSDPRVTYWEPAKWTARLRRETTSGDPVLLKINMEAGHGGASGRFDFLKEIALDYAFAVWAAEQGWGGMIVRPATSADAEAMAEIYGHNALHGAGTFEEAPPTPQEMAARLQAVQARGLPWVVVEVEGRVLGFAYAGPYRLRSAYRYTAEDSVYVAPGAQGQGVGRAALQRVIEACEAMGLRQLVAVIGDSANAGSVNLHRSLGFLPVGTLPDVGYKHGRWLDVVLMSRPLNGGSASAPGEGGLDL